MKYGQSLERCPWDVCDFSEMEVFVMESEGKENWYVCSCRHAQWVAVTSERLKELIALAETI